MKKADISVENRQVGIGGSDSPVIVGASHYKTVDQLWEEKLGMRAPVDVTPDMQRGTVLEPIAAELYAQKTGRTLRRVNQAILHPEHDFILGHLDRQIAAIYEQDGPGVLEIKCPRSHTYTKIKREGLSAMYNVQLQHYLAVSNRKWGAFAVFCADQWDMVFFDVNRDDELIDLIIAKDVEFWQLVQNKERPVNFLQTDEIKDLPPVEPSEIITVDSPEWKEAIERLRDAREIKTEAEALEDNAKARVIDLMGENQVVACDGSRVYYKTQAGRKIFDKKLLSVDHPEIDLSKYEKQGAAFRSFRPYFNIGGR